VSEALWGGYIATGYVDAIGFALVIVMLLVRPYGLFNKRSERV
jgi:branched-chain amino acid transport system permease protein